MITGKIKGQCTLLSHKIWKYKNINKIYMTCISFISLTECTYRYMVHVTLNLIYNVLNTFTRINWIVLSTEFYYNCPLAWFFIDFKY